MPGRPSVYQLPHRIYSGVDQMAIDGALLEWAALGPSRAVFRTYAWSRPTLSLGRAEPYPAGWDARALEAAGLDVVRRPTGGDAVLHDGELTFAVAASLPGPWALRPRAFADLVAEALAEALRELALPAERIAPGAESAAPGRPGDRPCFAQPSAGEVRVGPYKVAGIASRFTRGAALSHASVPLSPRHRDVAAFRANASGDRALLERHARSTTELLGRGLVDSLLGARVAAALSARLHAPLRPAGFADLGIAERFEP
jgi:lipoate-protein ligase A